VRNNWPIIGRLPINTKSYKNLTVLPCEIEKCCSCITNYSKTCFGWPPIR